MSIQGERAWLMIAIELAKMQVELRQRKLNAVGSSLRYNGSAPWSSRS